MLYHLLYLINRKTVWRILIMKRILNLLVIAAASLIIIPFCAQDVTAATVIKNIEMDFDLNIIDLNTSRTEGEVAERLRNNSSVVTTGASIYQGNADLFYLYSATEWYGTGTGTNMVSNGKEYGFSFTLAPDEGYDWAPGVKEFNVDPTPHVQTPISKVSGFTVSRGGQTIKDAWIKYNPNGNLLTIIIPARPDMKYAKVTGISDHVYDGKYYTISPTVIMYGEHLSIGPDYIFNYTPSKEPGFYGASLQGTGYYKGFRTIPYKILYKDVPGDHNYANAVYWATSAGLASGYSGAKKGIFGVGDPITRGQVLMMLWRAAGSPPPSDSTQTFKDVPTDHNFYKAIQWAYEAKIAGGYSGSKKGYFGPSDPCTRGQIVTFLWRFENKPAPSGSEQNFSDVPPSNNFFDAVNWAQENGIASGYSNGTFGVNKTCTRGHCVTFLYRDLAKG